MYIKETKYEKMEKLSFQGKLLNGGRFISRGKGKHAVRRIDSDELIYVVSGELAIYEERSNFELRSGEWLILRRGREHGGLKEYPSDLSFFWLHFCDENGFLEQLPQHGRAARPERLTEYCLNFIAEQQEKEVDPQSLSLLFQLILRELQRSEPVPGNRALSPLAQNVFRIVQLRFMEPLSPESLGRELRCNAEYLGRIYRISYGETLAETINTKRAEYAAKLLAETTLSVKEIQSLCGYNDAAYFRRRFFRRYAMTPMEFRRRYTRGHINSH